MGRGVEKDGREEEEKVRQLGREREERKRRKREEEKKMVSQDSEKIGDVQIQGRVRGDRE